MAMCCSLLCLNWRKVPVEKPLSLMRKGCIFSPRVIANEYTCLMRCNDRGNSAMRKETAVFTKKP